MSERVNHFAVHWKPLSPSSSSLYLPLLSVQPHLYYHTGENLCESFNFCYRSYLLSIHLHAPTFSSYIIIVPHVFHLSYILNCNLSNCSDFALVDSFWWLSEKEIAQIEMVSASVRWRRRRRRKCHRSDDWQQPLLTRNFWTWPFFLFTHSCWTTFLSFNSLCGDDDDDDGEEDNDDDDDGAAQVQCWG